MTTTRAALASLAGLAFLSSCEVPKLFNTPPSKVIAVTPTRVAVSADSGEAIQSWTLSISTSSGAAPTWTAHRVAVVPWLALADSNGSAPDTLAFTLNPADLAPRIYRDTIVVVPSDPSTASVRVPVELRVVATPPPPPPPPPTNQPPVASFNAGCSGLSCSFTNTSSDPDGTVASYSWT